VSQDVHDVVNMVTCIGDGEPTLIFVHGFGCDRGDFAAQCEYFARKHRAVAFDLPGHGVAPLPANAAFATLATALLEVRARFGGRHVLLVGHSLGCRVILEALARGCEGVSGLVLIEQNLVGGADPNAAAMRVQEKVNEIGIRAFLVPAFHAMFNAWGEATPLRDRVLERVQRLEPSFATRLLVESIAWEGSNAMRFTQMPVPILLIQSTCLDTSFQWHRLQPGMSTPWTERVLRDAPDARLEIISGPGHFVQIEAAEAVNQRIEAFLTAIEKRQ
jgi:pimeloyl-ACP methyl ester carboxylesterase